MAPIVRQEKILRGFTHQRDSVRELGGRPLQALCDAGRAMKGQHSWPRPELFVNGRAVPGAQNRPYGAGRILDLPADVPDSGN